MPHGISTLTLRVLIYGSAGGDGNKELSTGSRTVAGYWADQRPLLTLLSPKKIPDRWGRGTVILPWIQRATGDTHSEALEGGKHLSRSSDGGLDIGLGVGQGRKASFILRRG